MVGVGDGTAQAPEDYARLEDFPLTVAAGATSGSASFTLRPVDDSIDEDDETVSVVVTGKSDLEIVWSGASELVIADDDTRGVAVSPVSLTVDEGRDGHIHSEAGVGADRRSGRGAIPCRW